MGDELFPFYSKLSCATKSAEVHIDLAYERNAVDEVGVVGFNHSAWTVVPMVSLQYGRDKLLEGIRRLRPGGEANLGRPLVEAQHLLADQQPGVVRRVLMLTDGYGANPLRIARKLKANGIVIDVIGIGSEPSDVNEERLKSLSSRIKGQVRYQLVDDPINLKQCYTMLTHT